MRAGKQAPARKALQTVRTYLIEIATTLGFITQLPAIFLRYPFSYLDLELIEQNVLFPRLPVQYGTFRS